MYSELYKKANKVDGSLTQAFISVSVMTMIGACLPTTLGTLICMPLAMIGLMDADMITNSMEGITAFTAALGFIGGSIGAFTVWRRHRITKRNLIGRK